jgi:tRNA (guanine37-N1)-methyltransferase
MRIDVLTLFPEMFESPLNHSILKRAKEAGIVDIVLTNIRDSSNRPYGGGPGMVMMCQPVFDCFEKVEKLSPDKPRVILLTPQGKPFTQKLAAALAGEKRLILIAGHYEGFDERIRTGLNAEQISIGDYVLSGGELAAMVIIDAVVRLLPGALGDGESAEDETFSEAASGSSASLTAGGLEYPQYTRPETFQGMKVPDILLSGHHGEIEKWRRQQSLERTRQNRPDLLKDKQ